MLIKLVVRKIFSILEFQPPNKILFIFLKTEAPTSYMHTKPPVAWNDPPMVTPKVKAPVVKDSINTGDVKPTFYQPTMPLAATNLPPGQFYYPSQPQQQLQQNIMGEQFMSQNLPPTTQAQTFNPDFNDNSRQLQTPVPSSPNLIVNQQQQQPSQPQFVQRGPIAIENQIIQVVFDTLLNNCSNTTINPIIKRKLDDVAKKLEFLYDKLRDSAVCILMRFLNNCLI
jgi:hypothetical protein